MKRLIFLLLIIVSAFPENGQAQSDGGVEFIQQYRHQGVLVNSYDFKGIEPLLHRSNDTTYVINFWATWCAPCVAELPNFEKVSEMAKGKKLKVILVSLDMKRQVESALIPFLKKRGIQSQVLHLSDPDANAWIGKVNPDWSGALPATVIYKGDQRDFYERSFTFEALKQAIQPFFNL